VLKKKIMQNSVSLCFIAWNEEQGCEIDLPLIDRTLFDEISAIDGGSTDRTIPVFERFNIPVYRQRTLGLNAAYWQAVETSTCDHVIVFFPKGTLSASILPKFKDHLLNGQELVIASRMAPEGRNEEDDGWFKPRKWGICCLALFSTLVWRREGRMIWDVLHGVKGFSRRAFLAMNPSRTGVSIDLEMVVRSYRLRIPRVEFPVIEESRPSGTTRFKIIPTGIKLAKFLVAELFLAPPNSQFADVPDSN
jgi:glycosyltransferase involved in cell wall biosynthesis